MTHTQARGFRIFIFLALVIPAAAFAAKLNLEGPSLGDVNVSTTAIQWTASGQYDRVVLTISGPDGFSFTKEFTSGNTPILRVHDLGAKTPADGAYTWEMRLVPRVSAAVREKLAAAREADDDQAAARIQAEARLNREVM